MHKCSKTPVDYSAPRGVSQHRPHTAYQLLVLNQHLQKNLTISRSGLTIWSYLSTDCLIHIRTLPPDQDSAKKGISTQPCVSTCQLGLFGLVTWLISRWKKIRRSRAFVNFSTGSKRKSTLPHHLSFQNSINFHFFIPYHHKRITRSLFPQPNLRRRFLTGPFPAWPKIEINPTTSRSSLSLL